MRNLGTLCLKVVSPSNPTTQGSGTLVEVVAVRMLLEGIEEAKKTKATKTNRIGAHLITHFDYTETIKVST